MHRGAAARLLATTGRTAGSGLGVPAARAAGADGGGRAYSGAGRPRDAARGRARRRRSLPALGRGDRVGAGRGAGHGHVVPDRARAGSRPRRTLWRAARIDDRAPRTRGCDRRAAGEERADHRTRDAGSTHGHCRRRGRVRAARAARAPVARDRRKRVPAAAPRARLFPRPRGARRARPARGPAIAVFVALVLGAAVFWLVRRGRRAGGQAFAEAACPLCLTLGWVAERQQVGRLIGLETVESA